uniref:Uncharacterized protein n=1 Tax=Ficedula albicollis TaxID=59894 RepID=A0A803VSU6_FICAL
GPAARSRPFSPFAGQLSVEDTVALVLCKPKILPLKSAETRASQKIFLICFTRTFHFSSYIEKKTSLVHGG